MSISVVLADDHQIVREGLRVLFEKEPNVDIVGEASDGTQVVEVVRHTQPDVLILDLSMPAVDGLTAINEITRSAPETKVIVFSVHGNEEYVVDALRRGAKGFVLKDAPSEDLLRAVHSVSAGLRFLSQPLSHRAIEAYALETDAETPSPLAVLTGREIEVFYLTADGLSAREIGVRLAISHRTVESHRHNLKRKLNISSSAELIRFRERLTAPPSPGLAGSLQSLR